MYVYIYVCIYAYASICTYYMYQSYVRIAVVELYVYIYSLNSLSVRVLYIFSNNLVCVWRGAKSGVRILSGHFYYKTNVYYYYFDLFLPEVIRETYTFVSKLQKPLVL